MGRGKGTRKRHNKPKSGAVPSGGGGVEESGGSKSGADPSCGGSKRKSEGMAPGSDSNKVKSEGGRRRECRSTAGVERVEARQKGQRSDKGEEAVLRSIHDLPEDIIVNIIGRLNMRDGARTTALSRFWRPLWRRTPLDLDDRHLRKYLLKGDIRAVTNFIGRIIDGHTGEITRISFSFIWQQQLLEKFTNWCRMERFQHLDQLVLDFIYWAMLHVQPVVPPHVKFHVPLCVFSLPVVRSVTLANCHISLGSLFISANLSQLELRNVTSRPAAIQNIIRQAEKMETLILVGNLWSRMLRIRSMACLRRVFIVLNPDAAAEAENDSSDEEEQRPLELDKIELEKNINLEQLCIIQNIYGPSIEITGMPKLKFCGCFGWGNKELVIEHSHFFRTGATSLATQLRTVTTFSVNLIEPNIHRLQDFLECFPCLETLHIQRIRGPEGITDSQPGFVNPGHLLECMERTLKKVVFWDSTVRDDVTLCQYFINSAKLLDSVSLVTYIKCSEESINFQTREINFENKASPNAKLLYCLHRYCEITLQMDCRDDPYSLKLGPPYRTLK